jgi:hypothetical protein
MLISCPTISAKLSRIETDASHRVVKILAQQTSVAKFAVQ